MKNNKSKTKCVARYGVALSSIFVANEIQADIDTITWNGGQQDVVLTSTSTAFMDLDQLPNLIGNSNDFTAIRTSTYRCFGRFSSSCITYTGSVISGVPSVIAGVSSFDSGEAIPQNLTRMSLFRPRKQFLGFVTADGNQGWFRTDLNLSLIHI